MTQVLENHLRSHLLRADGQEDLCIAIYQRSTGAARTTALISGVIWPADGETEVRGNVSFTGSYVLRAAAEAARVGGGLVILHSHPGGRGWQQMSSHDADAEASYAALAQEITGEPLVGMTLAGGDGTWSGRFWRSSDRVPAASQCESIRVVGERLRISWNDDLVPAPRATAQQVRTVSCWGERQQADIARLRVLILGAGTLGLDVALRLAATGLQSIAVVDFDSLKLVNLDRMVGATELDVLLNRSKLDVAQRLLRANATADSFEVRALEGSICEPQLFQIALDYDIVLCCIDDRPWPRSVANVLAYADLVPVVDGGLHVDAFEDGSGMRNAVWRSHVLRPGRPCMACNGQLDLGKVQVDKDGLLEDEAYIAGLAPADRPQSQNVAALAISAAASLLAQFVSFVAGAAEMGEPGPLRYSLSTHWLEHLSNDSSPHCPVEARQMSGDRRQVLLGEHASARAEIAQRARDASRRAVRVGRALDYLLLRARRRLVPFLRSRNR